MDELKQREEENLASIVARHSGVHQAFATALSTGEVRLKHARMRLSTHKSTFLGATELVSI